MKTALAVMAIIAACLLAGDCCAQDSSRFQSVGGDFGKIVIGTFEANETQPSAASNNSNNSSNSSNSNLWNWGNAPKGSLLLNGKLLTDPFNTWKALNLTEGWIGEVEKDPFTGYPIYAYKIPNTGITKYFYIDPYTGEPIYVERSSAIVSANGVKSESYALPAIFR